MLQYDNVLKTALNTKRMLSCRKKSFDFKKEISSLQDGHSGLLDFLICGAVVKES
jgi:hypothetical protein